MEKFKYINHLNQVVEFGSTKLLSNYNDLRNYEWHYDTDFNKINNFNKDGIFQKKLPVILVGDNPQDAALLRNTLFETFEIDVLKQTPGKIQIGEYFYTCYVVSSIKGDYSSANNLLKLELNIISDTDVWTKETTYNFSKNQPSSGHGYVYGYPYNYASSANKSFFNDALSDSDFKLTIYGTASNPSIYLGEHLYSVETGIEANEYLEIDSNDKTVQKVLANGTRVSVLEFRNRDNYIFKKVPISTVSVGWNNSFGFDLTIFDERSEPKWSV